MDRFVARRNIEHFRQQLDVERDPAERAKLEQMLEEARAQLRLAEEEHRRDGPTRR